LTAEDGETSSCEDREMSDDDVAFASESPIGMEQVVPESRGISADSDPPGCSGRPSLLGMERFRERLLQKHGFLECKRDFKILPRSKA